MPSWRGFTTPRWRPRTPAIVCPPICRSRHDQAGLSSWPPARPRARWPRSRSGTTSTAMACPPAGSSGLAVTRHGYGRPTRHVRLIEAGHPVPDAAGLAGDLRNAGARRYRRAGRSGRGADVGRRVGELDRAGGEGSRSPRSRRSPARCWHRARRSPRSMRVRKHLSRIKGGRLAERISPARLVTIAISDVPGDDPAVIGSGPTVPDPTHARRRARDDRALSPRRLRRRWRRRSPIPQTKRRSPATPCSQILHSCWRRDHPTSSTKSRPRCAPAATRPSCSARASRARRAPSAAEHARLARRAARTGQARRDPVRRRTDRHACAARAAAARTRNTCWRWPSRSTARPGLRRLPATPTAPTAAAANRGSGRGLHRFDHDEPGTGARPRSGRFS